MFAFYQSSLNFNIKIIFLLVDGDWDTWSQWGPCSVSCGPGQQTKSRTCTNPAPAHGGQACTGNSTDIQSCNDAVCPGIYVP